MAHLQQFEFVRNLSKKFPDSFNKAKVLEVGSLDINGSIRQFFTDCHYIGLDIGKGKGVDIVCFGEQYDAPDSSFDTTGSCECFEHNPEWLATFKNMIRLTKSGGLVFFTCATEGRAEHGTSRTSRADAPFCGDYYRNLVESDFTKEIDFKEIFSEFAFMSQNVTHDLYFYGIKK